MNDRQVCVCVLSLERVELHADVSFLLILIDGNEKINM